MPSDAYVVMAHRPTSCLVGGGHGKGVRLNGSPLALRQGASACSRFDGGASRVQGGHADRPRDISRQGEQEMSAREP